MATSLSDDLLLEILSKLPLKPLSRFRCVSKAWRRLISDECIRSRPSQPLIVSGVFTTRGGGGGPRYGSVSGGKLTGCDLTPFPFHQNSELVDCCNGLLLFVTWSPAPAAFHVCNAVTGRWVPLPAPCKRAQLSVLAFDPLRSPHYKVISFTGWQAQGAELEVFSSETSKWAQTEVHWGLDNDAMSATMRYFDGALHILAYPQHMVRLDLETMTCRSIGLPAPTKRDGCIGMSGGRLHYGDGDGGRVRVWVMDDRCEWVVKECASARVDGMERGFNLLAFDPEREGVVYVWVHGKVLGYDVGKRGFEEVCVFGEEMEGAFVLQIWLFPFSRFMSECLTDVE